MKWVSFLPPLPLHSSHASSGKAWLVVLGILDILLSRCLLIQKHFSFSFSIFLPFALKKVLQFSVSLPFGGGIVIGSVQLLLLPFRL